MQRRLCEMSEAKWSITEAKCLQISHNKYAFQRDAISHSMGNLMLSHSAGMHNTDKSIAGISKRFHFASLHYIFSAYLPTHIKFLTEFRRIVFGTTSISFPKKMAGMPMVAVTPLTHPHTLQALAILCPHHHWSYWWLDARSVRRHCLRATPHCLHCGRKICQPDVPYGYIPPISDFTKTQSSLSSEYS